jgi:Slx4 endonuclease
MSDLEAESKPKPKPKKKPRTITEKATELYRRDFESADQGSAEPQTKASTSGKDTTKKKRSRKSKTALLNTLPPLPLLSPSSARLAFESQERIFGTCSQLAREDSPTTIRDLQTALKLSLDAIPESHATLDVSASTSQSSGRQSVGLLPSAKKLWEAASRDLDGKTAMPETIDLTDSPQGLSRLNLRPSSTMHAPMTTATEAHTYSEPPQPVFPEQPRTISVYSSEFPPGPVLDTVVAQPREASPDDRVSIRQEAMPDYEQLPDEELKAAIKTYGFKAMRNRKNMIARLKSCWESLHPDSTSATAMTKDTHPAPDVQEARPPENSKPKQASRKSHASTSKTIRALDNELTMNSPLPQAQTTTDRERLFTAIQKAITSSPPTSDPQNLSWHEKILLYDPLVIEDLTRWLNEGHLTRVGVDEEVAPVLVRDWCESRSICCLWRLNLRGAVRSRY